jgi:allantoin racemase
MIMRIGVVHVTTEAASGPYTKLITHTLDQAKADGTEIVHRYVQHLRRATDTAIAFPTLLNKVDIVAQVVQLARDGVDAAVVACSGDPGVAEARSLVDIPVVGPLEAALGLAMGYGFKFGILTVDDRTWGSNMTQMVQAYGMTDRYVGMRQLRTPTAEIFTVGFDNPERVLADMRDRGRELVADGAETILIGTAGVGTYASYFGFTNAGDAAAGEPDVPVFDMISIGVKFAELRAQVTAQMKLPVVSRAGWYATFDEANRARVNRLFGWTPQPGN